MTKVVCTLIAVLTLCSCAIRNPEALPPSPDNRVETYKCVPAYIWSATGPFTCTDQRIVSIWGLSTECTGAVCRINAVGRLSEKLGSVKFSVENNGYVHLEGVSTLRCSIVNTASKETSLCAMNRPDGIIVGGGEDLGCWLIKENLAVTMHYSTRFYQKYCGTRG